MLLFVLAGPMAAAAQQPLSEISLKDLMEIDAGRVFGASDRTQPVTEAPASVSFITADEIARYGYRTLADILRGIRGFYVTDERNFSFVGARGFGNPGDYNSRVLLLVNGHRVNDNVFGQAEIGAEFGLDPAMFERVEIIRGPASSLYGDSAFFGVINVITKSGLALGNASVTAGVGTLGTHLLRGSTGHRFTNGAEIALSGTFEGSAGVDRLYFPEFDSPATNNGIAEGLDGERIGQFYGRATFSNFTFTGAYGRRRRHVPTASFGSRFNEQEDREQTVDRHSLADLEYATIVGATRLSIRGSFDRFTYEGTYPTEQGAEAPPLVGEARVIGTRWSAVAKATRTLPGRQVLTAGVEFIDNVEQNQSVLFEAEPSLGYRIERSSIQYAVYVQDELRLSRWLILNGGARYDHYEQFQRLSPRTAVIVMPSSNQSIKYLFGSAFRAPNANETNEFNFGERTRDLRPESINTHELVWERYSRDWLRTSVSGYWYDANRLITQVEDPSAFVGTTYVNAGQVHATGLELEAQMGLGRLQGVFSYAVQRARDMETDARLANSPTHMGKFRLSIPGPLERSSISTEVQAMSARKTRKGNTVGAAAIANVTALVPLGRSFELTGTLRNLFDSHYEDPVSDQHVQDAIPQNGRTFRVGLTWKYMAR